MNYRRCIRSDLRDQEQLLGLWSHVACDVRLRIVSEARSFGRDLYDYPLGHFLRGPCRPALTIACGLARTLDPSPYIQCHTQMSFQRTPERAMKLSMSVERNLPSADLTIYSVSRTE